MSKENFSRRINLENLILGSEFVFFDIFDTLITRPFANPKGLFSYIEYQYKTPGFFKARIKAESLARTEREEVTLDEIYEQIHPSFRKFKEIEPKLEMSLCYRINDSYKLYQNCIKNNKKVYFISDMYLDKNTILEILNKNGYNANNENLFLSSALKKTKHTGSLYDFVLETLKITTPSNVVMIGDNLHSDVIIPREKGLNAHHFKQEIHHRKFTKELFKSLRPESSLSPILKTINDSPSNQLNYWQEIGFTIAGPLVYSYIKYILHIINNFYYDNRRIKVLFIGRDGYLLNKCFSMFNSEIPHEYIYAPRALARKADITYQSFKNSSKLDPNNTEADLVTYRLYLDKYTHDSDHLLIVDSRSASFSAQNLIQTVTNCPVSGIYWEVNANSELKSIFPHHEFKNAQTSITAWRLFEFLITSPEPPIKTINKELLPVYQFSQIEKDRSEHFFQIEIGCLSFIQNLVSRFHQTRLPFISYEAIVTFINVFLKNPTKRDIHEFQSALLAVDPNHKKYLPFLSTKYNQCNIRQFLKELSQCQWRTPLQSIILNLIHPFQIRTSKTNKALSIYIFPKLDHSIFAISINLHIFTIELSIGKKNNYFHNPF